MNSKKYWINIGGILVLALLLRLSGIMYGSNEVFRPDEDNVVGNAFTMSKTGDLNPHEFKYPAFQRYLLLPFFSAEFLLEVVNNRDIIDQVLQIIQGKSSRSSLREQIASMNQSRVYQGQKTSYILFGRILTVFMGVATVLLTGLLARRIYGNYWGILAAALLAVNFLHVRDSHFATLDVPAAFWGVLVIWFCCRIMEHGSWKDYLLAGLFTGFAIGTKYNMLIVFLPVLAAHWQSVKKQKLSLFQWKQSRRMVLAMVLVAVGFYLTNPYVFYDFRNFKLDFLSEMQHMRQGHFELKDASGWAYHISYTLPYGLGWGIYALSLWGIAVAFWKRHPFDWVLIAFVIPYLVAFSPGYTIFVRYMIPMVPLLCLFAVRGIVAAVEWLPSKSIMRNPMLLQRAGMLLVILLVIPGFVKSAYFDYLMTRDDTRILAKQWLEANVPYNSRMGLMTYYMVETLSKSKHYQLAPITNDTSQRVYLIKLNQFKKDAWKFNVDYYMLDFHPVLYSIPLTQLPVMSRDTPIAVFSPMRNTQVLPVKEDFNYIDAFYLPYKNLFQYSRSGPLICIYKTDTTGNLLPAGEKGN